jgi:hypothetical protein
MKHLFPLLLASCIHAHADGGGQVSFLRQQQQGTEVVWDMPLAAQPTPLSLTNGGTLFQFWTVESTTAKDHLRDQKRMAAYLPSADIKVRTLDLDAKSQRTRVDQPFTLEIQVDGLLTGSEFPLSAANVLLERHLVTAQDGSTALSANPARSALLNSNGKTVLRFEASSLSAADPTKASGEELFVIHTLSDGSGSQTQIASASVQVLPVASGAIKGISTGETLRFQVPELELALHDLYPRSETHLMLFQGGQINGTQGEIIRSHPLDAETTASTTLRVSDLDSRITSDGTYTLALLSDTIYGRELLCNPVTFTVKRTDLTHR